MYFLQYEKSVGVSRKQTPMFRDTPSAFTAMYTGYNVTTNEDETADGDSSIQLFFLENMSPLETRTARISLKG
jgi:hypothetical protein